MGIVYRLILTELVKVFLVSLAVVTVLFVVAGLIQEATLKGLTPVQVLQAIPLMIPSTLPYTMPATTLFATCLVYSRMSADNEVLVLRMSGANIHRLVWPAVWFGLGTTGIMAALYVAIIPLSQRLMRDQMLEDAEGVVNELIKRNGGLKHDRLDFELFVREVQGRDLIDVVIKKRNADRSGYEWVAMSNTASVRVEYRTGSPDGQESRMVTPDPPPGKEGPDPRPGSSPAAPGVPGEGYHELIVRMNRCNLVSVNGETLAEAECQEFVTPLPDAIFGRDMRGLPSSQTWGELFERREEMARVRAALWGPVAADREAVRRAGGPPANAQDGMAARHREGRFYFVSRLLTGIRSEIHLRPVLSTSCLCFALIGCPVGIRAGRVNYLGVFLVCFMPVVFVYYPLLLASLNLALNGRVPPASIWLTNGLAVGVAIGLIPRLMKR